MILFYGMGKKLECLAFGPRHEHLFLGRDIAEEKNYSEETSRIIDDEIKTIVSDAWKKAKETLQANIDKLKLLAETLIEKEVLDSDEVKALLNLADVQAKNDNNTPGS